MSPLQKPSGEEAKRFRGPEGELAGRFVGISKDGQGEAKVGAKSDQILQYLAKSFIEDYMRRKYAQERSGWRSIPEVARSTGLSAGRLYGRRGGLSRLVNELIRGGYIELRLFPGERGRGGEVSKLRISYELKPIQSYVDKVAMGSGLSWEGPGQLDRLRIAVLPFVNLGPGGGDEYFADGLTEELISTLSKIGQLTLIARTSVMPYKNSTKRVSEISEELRSGTIIEGSVRRSQNRVRIAAQLLDGRTEGHLWSESYDREMHDILDIQSEISVKVAEALRIRLNVGEERDVSKRGTESIGAYLLYLKGRYFLNERTKESLDKAVDYFHRAIKLDSRYALAYSGLAHCYVLFGARGFLSPQDSFPEARNLAMKSLELDSRMAEAHTILADVLNSYEGKWQESEFEYRKALELKPSYSTAHMWYGLLLSVSKRFEEARMEITRALELDPLNRVGALNLAGVSLYEGRTGVAVDELETAVETDPEFPLLHMALGWAYFADNRQAEAVIELKKAVRMAKGDLQLKADLAIALGFAGKRKEASTILNELQEKSEKGYVSRMKLAQVFLSLGKNDVAFGLLEEALDDHSLFTDHSSFLLDLMLLPWFSRAREDPRWREFVRRLGIP